MRFAGKCRYCKLTVERIPQTDFEMTKVVKKSGAELGVPFV